MPSRDRSDITPDERLIFFPTIGRRGPSADTWQLPIHGWVFRPENDSLRRAAALSLLRRWIGLEAGGEESSLFQQRLRTFLVDNQPHKVVTIRLGPVGYTLPASTADGHIRGMIEVAAATIASLAGDSGPLLATPDSARTLDFQCSPQPADLSAINGRVHLVAAEGLSVISDIDDTIKVTHVKDRAALVRQTFLRPFEAVTGMADVYQEWRDAGATFHYVSRSPWQLYTALDEFIGAHGFPSGTFHLRKFRWKNAGTLANDRDGSKKLAEVEAILTWLPQRRFLLVGDSGEQDPEIYGELARRYPQQIERIHIRNVSAEERSGSRLQSAFAKIPAERWNLFDDARELHAT